MLAFLHDTASLDRQLHYRYHCFYSRTWTERDCGSRTPFCDDIPFWRVPWKSPLFTPRHMFYTLGRPTSVASRVVRTVGRCSCICRRPSGAIHRHTGRAHTKRYSTVGIVHHVLYRCALPIGSRSSIPLPAFTFTLHPHLSLSTSALHICTSVGKVTSATFLFVDVSV